MHTSIILDPETCVYDAKLFGDERTNKAILGVGSYNICLKDNIIEEEWSPHSVSDFCPLIWNFSPQSVCCDDPGHDFCGVGVMIPYHKGLCHFSVG